MQLAATSPALPPTLAPSETLEPRLVEPLRRRLVDSGYRTFHLAFGDGNRSWNAWTQHVDRLEDPLRALVELLLLQRSVSHERALAALGPELLDALERLNILAAGGEQVRSRGLILISFRSLFIFHEHNRQPRVYFGNDSIALGVYQTPSRGGNTLDLCAGTGIQAMVAAVSASHAHAVEINPRAAHLARVNAALNGLSDRISIHNVPFEEFVQSCGETFDLITFNPPLLPVPEELYYPFVGDGGKDGLDVTRRALELYLPRLNPGGAAEFVGCGLGKGDQVNFVDDLAEILARHGCRGEALLLARCPTIEGNEFHDALVLTAAMNSKVSPMIAYVSYEMLYKELDRDVLYTFFFRAQRPVTGRAGGEVLITPLASDRACWFLPA